MPLGVQRRYAADLIQLGQLIVDKSVDEAGAIIGCMNVSVGCTSWKRYASIQTFLLKNGFVREGDEDSFEKFGRKLKFCGR